MSVSNAPIQDPADSTGDRGTQGLVSVAIGAFTAMTLALITRPALEDALVIAGAFLSPALWIAFRTLPGEPRAIRLATFLAALAPLPLAQVQGQ